MKILAVKGSKEHGEEIIKLFEALGGENTQELSGVPDVYWIVQWNSRFGEYSRDVVRTSIPFFSKEQADKFAESLRKAHAFLKNTNDINIEIIEINA